MTNFIPGKAVKVFKSKKGEEIIIRYPKWEDLETMTTYINKLSKEDTFILFSGEEITKREEAEFLGLSFKDMEMGDKIMLGAYKNDRLIGLSHVERNTKQKKRSLHTAIFGISVAKDYRSFGIGYELATAIINEAINKIPGLRIITLTVFGPNHIAQGLYKKLGFAEGGHLKGVRFYRNQYIDEKIMTLNMLQ